MDPAVVRLLLEHAADPNLADRDGATPLLHSLLPHGDEAKHLEILRLLIGSGACEVVSRGTATSTQRRGLQDDFLMSATAPLAT